MEFFDTHTHLYLPEFEEDGGGVAAVHRANEAGVRYMVMPNVDLTTIAPLRALQSAFPEQVFSAMGLHPTEIGESWTEDLQKVIANINPDDVAIGEIGVDLYWDTTFRDAQMQAFEMQAKLAVEKDLPIIIHNRNALNEVLEVLEGVAGVRGVFHCFGDTANDVERIRRRLGDEWYFGIGGVVTFKNSRLADALPAITIDRIVLETDSPYLAPVPKRGRRNESAFLPFTGRRIAEALAMDTEDVARITTANACKLFAV